MDFSTLVRTRRSVRSFIDKEVPEDLIMKLLDAASWAPSAGNRQPWHFFVVKDKGQIASFHGDVCHQSWLLEAPVLIVVCAEVPRSESRYHDRGRDLYCIQDTAAAVQNILLCATSLGLATCWVGAFNEEECSKLLNLDKGLRPVAIIPVGYTDSEPKAPKRRDFNDIVSFL